MRKAVFSAFVILLLSLAVAAPRAYAQQTTHRTSTRRTQAHRAAKSQAPATAQEASPDARTTKHQPATSAANTDAAAEPSDKVTCTLASCATFNLLIGQKDRTLSLSLFVPQAYACFNPQGDGFLVVGYSVSSVWEPQNGQQTSDGWVTSDRYENGEDIDSDLAVGDWHGLSESALQFHENSGSDGDSALNVATSDSLFSFSRSYKTIQGKDVSVDLKISLPSLHFSETYTVEGQQQLSVQDGQCSSYAFDSRNGGASGTPQQ
jgi:hypothetical protein